MKEETMIEVTKGPDGKLDYSHAAVRILDTHRSKSDSRDGLVLNKEAANKYEKNQNIQIAKDLNIPVIQQLSGFRR